MNKITEEEFLQRFQQRKDREEYVYQNDFQGWNTHIILIHKNCGKEYKVTPYSLCVKRNSCPYCYHQRQGKNRRINEEEIIEKFNEVSNGEYQLLEEYKGIATKTLIKHNKCGKEFRCSLYSFLRHNHRCKCERGLETITEEQALKFLQDNFPNIHLVGKYNGWRNKNEFFCENCNSKITKRFIEFKNQKYGCTKCYNINNVGRNNKRWKGGNTEFIRAMRVIINPWKFDSAKFYNNKCIITGASGGNEVHHLSKNFMEILDETLSELNLQRHDKISDYTQEEYEKLTHTLLQKHYEYGYGVVINKKLHREFHYKFGFYNNNFDQFKQYCKEIGVEIQLENNKIITNNKTD